MNWIPKVFTAEIKVNKFDAETFIGHIETRIDIERILHDKNIPEDQNACIQHLTAIKSEALKLFKI